MGFGSVILFDLTLSKGWGTIQVRINPAGTMVGRRSYVAPQALRFHGRHVRFRAGILSCSLPLNDSARGLFSGILFGPVKGMVIRTMQVCFRPAENLEGLSTLR